MFMLNHLTGFNASSGVSYTVTAIGTNNSGGAATTLAMTTTADVPAGSLIVVVAGNSSSNNISSVTDSAGNTYAVDISATGTIRGDIASAPNCLALASGSTITVTYAASSSARVALAASIVGVATSSPLDKTAGATGTSTTPSSGSTATTTKADEIAIGMVCYDRNANPTFTEDALYTTIDSVIGGANVDRLNFAYQILTATGTPSYAPTQGLSKQWSCAIATYKAL